MFKGLGVRQVGITTLMMIAALAHAQQTHLQIPCPVMLVSGDADRDSIQLSFRNKGKMPIQELSFACSPPMQGTGAGLDLSHGARALLSGAEVFLRLWI